MPALLIRISRRRSSPRIERKRSSTEYGSRTSQQCVTTRTSLCLCVSSLPIFTNVFSSRLVKIKLQPSPASPPAMARPIPRLAPVTRAVLPPSRRDREVRLIVMRTHHRREPDGCVLDVCVGTAGCLCGDGGLRPSSERSERLCRGRHLPSAPQPRAQREEAWRPPSSRCYIPFGRCRISDTDSPRVSSSLRKHPSIELVTAAECCFSTPRIIMQRCRASITTPTPCGSITF